MTEIMNSWWMYLLGSIVVVFVIVGSVFFMINAFKEAKKMNMESAMLKKVIINSAIFTILPSISILIGVVALAGTLGVPLPWIRLTVIGALHYEGTAVKTTLDALGSEVITEEAFVTIAFVMTLGILTGPLFCLFGFKAYDKKILSKTRDNEEKQEIKPEEVVEDKPKKKSFGDILFNAVFIAMVSSFLAVDAIKIFDTNKIGELNKDLEVIEPIDTFIPLIVIVVTFLSMWLFDFLEKKCKQKWLSSFGLGLAMIIGMASAVLANYIYGIAG